jgi:hypothetical protein
VAILVAHVVHVKKNVFVFTEASILSFNTFHWLALRADVVDVEVKLSITCTCVGIGHQSFIALPVVPSNTARCPLTAPLGHDTSHVPAPCADITLLASIVIHAHAVSFGWKFRST